jgi:hypothetical protein
MSQSANAPGSSVRITAGALLDAVKYAWQYAPRIVWPMTPTVN